MLEDVIQKRELASEMIDQLNELIKNGNREKLKGLIDKCYVASFEQSLAIAKEISEVRRKLAKKDISEDEKRDLMEMIYKFTEMYTVSAMESRLLIMAGQEYGLTNVPKG